MVKKINMKLNEYSYNKLKNLNEGSIDKNLNLLIDAVGKDMPKINYGEKTKTVNAYSDTYERLDEYRITLGESRDNIITRMLIQYETLNSHETLEIPFKLTSPLNPELVILGLYTADGVIYDSVNSFEFKAWEKLLDWKEIEELILHHEFEKISYNKPNYRIDINFGK